MTAETDRTASGSTQRPYQNRTDETLSQTVVRALASASGRSAFAGAEGEAGQSLDPLYETIDPGALDALFRDRTDDPPATGTVEFVYCGYDVTVEAPGAITVRER